MSEVTARRSTGTIFSWIQCLRRPIIMPGLRWVARHKQVRVFRDRRGQGVTWQADPTLTSSVVQDVRHVLDHGDDGSLKRSAIDLLANLASNPCRWSPCLPFWRFLWALDWLEVGLFACNVETKRVASVRSGMLWWDADDVCSVM